jgi:hypothetical protein
MSFETSPVLTKQSDQPDHNCTLGFFESLTPEQLKKGIEERKYVLKKIVANASPYPFFTALEYFDNTGKERTLVFLTDAIGKVILMFFY